MFLFFGACIVTVGSHIKCCMLWKRIRDESTVISLSRDSLLERATQLDQSFCAFSVPLIRFQTKQHLNWNVALWEKKLPELQALNDPCFFFNTHSDLDWRLLFRNSYVYFFRFSTAPNVRIYYRSKETQLKDELFSNKESCNLVSCFLTFISLSWSLVYLPL